MESTKHSTWHSVSTQWTVAINYLPAKKLGQPASLRVSPALLPSRWENHCRCEYSFHCPDFTFPSKISPRGNTGYPVQSSPAPSSSVCGELSAWKRTMYLRQEGNEGVSMGRTLAFFLSLLRQLPCISEKRETHFSFIPLTFRARILQFGTWFQANWCLFQAVDDTILPPTSLHKQTHFLT